MRRSRTRTTESGPPGLKPFGGSALVICACRGNAASNQMGVDPRESRPWPSQPDPCGRRPPRPRWRGARDRVAEPRGHRSLRAPRRRRRPAASSTARRPPRRPPPHRRHRPRVPRPRLPHRTTTLTATPETTTTAAPSATADTDDEGDDANASASASAGASADDDDNALRPRLVATTDNSGPGGDDDNSGPGGDDDDDER